MPSAMERWRVFGATSLSLCGRGSVSETWREQDLLAMDPKLVWTGGQVFAAAGPKGYHEGFCYIPTRTGHASWSYCWLKGRNGGRYKIVQCCRVARPCRNSSHWVCTKSGILTPLTFIIKLDVSKLETTNPSSGM